MNERKTKGLTNLNSDEKSFGKLVCPWPECIFYAVCCNFLLFGDSREVTHRITSKFCDDKEDILLYPRVSGGRSPNDDNSNRQHWKTVWTKTNLPA